MNTTTTKPTDVRLQLKKFIRARRDRVFAAWTQPELLKRWHVPGTRTTGRVEADAQPGGAYRIEMKAGGDGGCDCSGGDCTVAGKYLKVVPNELLVYTWQWQEDPEAVETLVTVAFADAPGGTELTLTHERFASEESRDKHEQGWGGCLENLAGLVARGGLGA